MLPTDPTALGRVEAMLTHEDEALGLTAAQVLEPLYEPEGERAKVAGLVELTSPPTRTAAIA